MLECLPGLFSLPDCIQTVAEVTVESCIARLEADAVSQLWDGFGMSAAVRQQHAQVVHGRASRRIHVSVLPETSQWRHRPAVGPSMRLPGDGTPGPNRAGWPRLPGSTGSTRSEFLCAVKAHASEKLAQKSLERTFWHFANKSMGLPPCREYLSPRARSNGTEFSVTGADAINSARSDCLVQTARVSARRASRSDQGLPGEPLAEADPARPGPP